MERDRDTAVSGACLDALAAVLEGWDGGIKRKDEAVAVAPVAAAALSAGGEDQQRQAA
jgi:hypothetical protein